MAKSKQRNLEEQVYKQYFKRNNLNLKLRTALCDLNTKVKNKEIVICKSDKDGKLIVLNHNDYKLIMSRELKTF